MDHHEIKVGSVLRVYDPRICDTTVMFRVDEVTKHFGLWNRDVIQYGKCHSLRTDLSPNGYFNHISWQETHSESLKVKVAGLTLNAQWLTDLEVALLTLGKHETQAE